MRVSQYPFIVNSSFDDKSRITPDWINEYHVSADESFIPQQNDGFCGPIVSYWCKVSQINRWFR